MKFDELDSFVDDLFSRPAYLPQRETVREQLVSTPAVPAGEQELGLYYWREPEGEMARSQSAAGAALAWELARSQPLGLWNIIKGLLLLAAGLLLLVSLSEAGVI